MKARWFNNYVCKNEAQLIERLDQAILDVINHPKKDSKYHRFRNVLLTNALIALKLWQEEKTLYLVVRSEDGYTILCIMIPKPRR